MFLMPYAELGDLDFCIEKRHFFVKIKMNMVIDIWVAVSELHAVNLVHRDLKPASMLNLT